VDLHAIVPTVDAIGRPAAGACQDPDERVAVEKFANDAAAEVTGGSGDEDGGGSDDVLFSVWFCRCGACGRIVGSATGCPNAGADSHSDARSRPGRPRPTPFESGPHADIVLGAGKMAGL
jgi:hypothetical protein